MCRYNMQNTSMNIGLELVYLNRRVEEQELLIDKLILKASEYKARYFGKYDLADKLADQIDENSNHLIGAWDGYCYSSDRARARYRTLEDMALDGIITENEYQFCDVR